MKPEDKINKFFEKRLQDDSPADDLWNVPSDDIWNKAKVHFPKKKEKKKRPFIFFIFGIGLLLVLTAGLTFWVFGNAEKNAVIVKQIEEVKSQRDQESQEVKRLKGQEVKGQKVIEQEVNSQETDSQKDKVNLAGNTTKKEYKATNENKSRINPAIIARPSVENDATNLVSDGSVEDATNFTSTPSTQTVPNQVDEEKAIVNKTEIEKAIPASENVIDETVQKESILALQQIPVLLASVESDMEEEEEEELEMDYKLIKPKRSVHRWEVGLSHSRFLLNPKKAIIEGSETGDNETQKINFGYRNLNIPVSRWFNRKWSMTSGLSLSQINLGIDFSVVEAFEMAPTIADYRMILNDSGPPGDLSLNGDTSQELEVELLPGASIEDGDTLTIHGNVPIKLNVVQLPILFNYHFGKGKLEGLIHTGVSLDLLQASINSFEFEVFKDGNLISEPVNITPLKDYEFGMSVYLGVGVKYYITNKINLGLSTKIDVTAPIFSRHEIGLYYGF